MLGRKLQDESKESKKPIKVIESAKVDRYLASHPNEEF